MRPGQQNKRGRGRSNNSRSNNSSNSSNNNNHRKSSNPLTRTYDSSGPDVKIRGTAQHIAEKYSNLARDAQSSGDRVVAENYLQHAEHYNRIILAAQAQMQERFQRDDRNEFNERDQDQEQDQDQDQDSDQTDLEGSGNGNSNGNGNRNGNGNGHNQNRNRNPNQNNANNPAPAPVAAVSEPVIDGSGPQPVIDGTPVEVSLEAEAPAGRAAPRRRNPVRARRPRRGDGAAEGGEAAPAEADDDAPKLADVASE